MHAPRLRHCTSRSTSTRKAFDVWKQPLGPERPGRSSTRSPPGVYAGEIVKDMNRGSEWPEQLAPVGAIRFARSYWNFKEAVDFFRDVVGLPLYETFRGSYGTNGAIFAMPTPAVTFEIVEATEPIPVSAYDALVLYFPDADAQQRAISRLDAEGVQREADQHPYWAATGGVTYRDPDGREVVFAPFVYGRNEPREDSAY